MAHDRLILPLKAPPEDELPPEDDTKTEFDTSDVTRTRIRGVDAEIYIGGVERALAWLKKHTAESFAETHQRIDALAAETRHANEVAERNNKAIEELTAEIRKAMKFMVDGHGDHIKLADRVSTLEQPPVRRRSKK